MPKFPYRFPPRTSIFDTGAARYGSSRCLKLCLWRGIAELQEKAWLVLARESMRKQKPCQWLKQRLSRQSFAGNCLHHVREAIQLAERGVNVGRDANALEFFVNDRGRKDPMLIK